MPTNEERADAVTQLKRAIRDVDLRECDSAIEHAEKSIDLLEES